MFLYFHHFIYSIDLEEMGLDIQYGKGIKMSITTIMVIAIATIVK